MMFRWFVHFQTRNNNDMQLKKHKNLTFSFTNLKMMNESSKRHSKLSLICILNSSMFPLFDEFSNQK